MSDRAAMLALKQAMAKVIEALDRFGRWREDPCELIPYLLQAKALLEQVAEELGEGLPIEEVIRAGQAKVEESRGARRRLDTRMAIIRDRREP